MLATFIIVFREVIEASLIVGIILAAAKGLPGLKRWMAYGFVGGILGSCIVALLAGQISRFMEGIGTEVFNAVILSVAALMLIWHNIWMARHGKDIALNMKAIGSEIVAGKRTLTALAIVVGVAILREGSEIVLFLYGVALSGVDSVREMAFGGFLGLLVGVCIGAITYLGLVKIPSKSLFAVTSWLIALLAAGMAAQAVAYLQQADIFTLYSQVLWNSARFVANDSYMGKALHTLIGYTDRPTGMQLIVYTTTLLLIFGLMRFFKLANTPQKTQ